MVRLVSSNISASVAQNTNPLMVRAAVAIATGASRTTRASDNATVLQANDTAPSWFETIRLLTKPNLLTMRELGPTRLVKPRAHTSTLRHDLNQTLVPKSRFGTI